MSWHGTGERIDDLAYTKAEHDRIVAAKGRPLMQGPMIRRQQPLEAGAAPDTPSRGDD